MKRSAQVSGVLLACAVATLTACFSFDRPPADKRRFLLEAARPKAEPAASSGHLQVATMRVHAPWAGPGFVHRLPGGELRTDFTHEFFVPAGVLLAEITRRWLADSGRFASVGSEASRMPATHWLEADVLEMSVDARETNNLQAILEIEFVVLNAERSPAHRARLRQVTPLPDAAGATIVAAWNTCVAKLLTDFEAVLR